MNSIIQPVEDDIPSLQRRDIYFVRVTKIIQYQIFFEEVTQSITIPSVGVWSLTEGGINYNGADEDRSSSWIVRNPLDDISLILVNDILLVQRHHSSENLFEIIGYLTPRVVMTNTNPTNLCVTINTKEYECNGTTLIMTPVTTQYNIVTCPTP